MNVKFRWQYRVAPFVGAWIEMTSTGEQTHKNNVAPFVGAWIEITVALFDANEDVVAPFVGAWIEISRVGGNL